MAKKNCCNDLFADYHWPSVPALNGRPIFRNGSFEIDGQRFPFLQYHDLKSSWSEELTELHERERGRDHPIAMLSRSLAISAIARRCAASAYVLDVGCSSGYLVKEVRHRLPAIRIIASDYLPMVVARAAQRLRDVPVLQFDLRECPLPDMSLDAVIALNVLEHIKEDDLALSQIFRVLKPGGIAHIEVPAGPHLYDIYDEVLMHQRRYKMRQLVTKLKTAGFKMLNASHLGFLVYPAFWLTKKNNRRLLDLTSAEKKSIVVSQIRKTRQSWLLRMTFSIEKVLIKILSLPTGIRCVVTCTKVANRT